MSDIELQSQFPNASRIMLRVMSDPEVSAFIDEVVKTWREHAESDKAAERERCAKIVESVIKERERMHEEFSEDESWQWAINEMREEVNTAWCQSDALILDIPIKIRSGE